MSIEDESQKDLALNEEDAENVVGGKMNKKKAQKAKAKPAHQATAAAAPIVVVGAPLSSSSDTSYSGEPVDPAAQEVLEDC